VTVPFEPGALPLGVLAWPLLFGLGAYLLLTAQPIGEPKPDLGEMLRRLDVDERVRSDLGAARARPMFASRLLEGMLRPVLDDAGRLLRALLARFGLGGGAELERALRLVRAGVDPPQFFGEKVAIGLLGLGFAPALNAFGVQPFGHWPLWVAVVGGTLGFLVPDWDLERRVAARRAVSLAELPPLVDMLTIAVAAGLALEEALVRVAREGRGVVADELMRASREAALGQTTLVGALEAMAERNGVAELASLVSQLRASHEQGLPLVQTLTVQADALREKRRLGILEAGGRATAAMLIPVALCILPVLFVVLLVPAFVQIVGLGG
jgi:tight adherence protein C